MLYISTCIYNTVGVFAPVSASTHLQQPACPPLCLCGQRHHPLATSYWTLASPTCSSAIQPCTPSTLKAPSFLSTEELVHEEWEMPGQEPTVFRNECLVCQAGRTDTTAQVPVALQRKRHTGAL